MSSVSACSFTSNLLPILLLITSVAGCSGAPDPGAPLFSFPQFTDVAPDVGLGAFRHVNGAEGRFWFPEQMGAGGGFVDIDGDGWEDVLLVGGGRLSPTGPRPESALRVYLNEGGVGFVDATEALGLTGLESYGTGVVAADYDNDGDQDIYLTAFGPNRLLRNDPAAEGAGRRLVDVAVEAGVDRAGSWSSSALFFDADLDGNPDLFVAGYAEWSPDEDVDCQRGGVPDYCPPATYGSSTSHFFRNLGDGTFEEATVRAGLSGGPGKSLALAEWDFNDDGWPDFVVVNDGQPDLLYLNDGDGTFTEQGVQSGIAFGEHGEARAGMGVDIGILDPTGQPSIMVGNFSSEMMGVYRRTPSGWFVDRSAASRVGRASLTSLAFGVLYVDVDLDADLDVFVANGHVYTQPVDGSSYRERPHLLVNEYDGSFVDRATQAGLGFDMVARSVSAADYDRDGDVDLLVTENDGPAHLLRNDTDGGQVLRVRVNGDANARDALGAQVTIVAGNRTQIRRVRTGSGYLSQSERTLTFGLGNIEVVDTLRVRWPDRTTTIWTGLDAGQEIEVSKDGGRPFRRSLPIVASLDS